MKPPARPRILYVEDEPDVAALVVDLLDPHGFEIRVVGSGELALDELTGFRPDLLLLDLMLPGMDGITLCMRIRERSHMPIIVVSARAEERYQNQAMAAGANAYVIKPFDLRALVTLVLAHLPRI
jgi:DNA-binding response OmpR family regulator